MKKTSGSGIGTLVLLLLLLCAASTAWADVSVPGFFGDHMVLQRDEPIAVWGRAEPGEKVTVKLSRRTARTTTGEDGRWRVELEALPAGGPYTLTVKGDNTLRIKDVLMGDVWLCSGQSNMAWQVRQSHDAKGEIARAKDDEIRHIQIPRKPAATPQGDVSAEWQVCSPETVATFSAVAYSMARELRKELKVPIGLLHASWGGTRIEPWIPQEGLDAVEALSDVAEQARAAAGKAPENHQQPTVLHDGMVQPLVGYGIRGVIWYQGESNHRDGMAYVEKKRALVEGWRGLWKRPELPFHFVQIAPFRYGKEDPAVLPSFWEAQTAVVDAVPHTAMVVVNDIGEADDIHPGNKQEVGRRLALLALARVHGEDVVCEGPRFREMTVEGDAIRVSFDHAEGLTTRDGEAPTHFEIAGENSGYRPAVAKLDGQTVVLRGEGIETPTAMRFGWHKLAVPNLVNGAGLPTSAFRSGELPRADHLGEVEEASDYTLVYDLDLEDLGVAPAYSVDRHEELEGAFDRVAYLLELRLSDGAPTFVWVSMDAFTDDAGKIAIPTAASGAHFQQAVTGLSIVTNVDGLPTGSELAGRIEMWPNHYGAGNADNVPGASSKLWDFGDSPGQPVDGYGSMQVHVPSAATTLFALNFWRNGGSGADLGIGNSSVDDRSTDWTFARNSGAYLHKRLRVFVRLRQG